MHSQKTIQIITDKRSDALHIHVQSLMRGLKKVDVNVEVIELDNRRFKNPLLNFLLEIVNTLKTILIVDRSAVLLFADPLSFNLMASRFLKNKKYRGQASISLVDSGFYFGRGSILSQEKC